MKFKGKVAIWYWALIVLINVALLYAIFVEREAIIGMLIVALTVDFIMVPMAVRNYVLLQDDKVTVCFGFGNESMEIKEIVEVYRTHDPMASTAASLDRIVIKSKRTQLMCAVQEKARFFEELARLNSGIVFR